MSDILGRDYKTPTEKLTYTHDCTPSLGGSTVSGSSWTITPSGMTTVGTGQTTTTASIQVSGGVAGQLYTLEVTVTLADGTILQGSHEVQVLK